MSMGKKSVVGEREFRSVSDERNVSGKKYVGGERNVSEQELAGVSGGVTGSVGAAGGLDFPWIVREFARMNDCAGCPKKQVYRQHEMCMEVYGRLAAEYSKDGSVSMKCSKR